MKLSITILVIMALMAGSCSSRKSEAPGKPGMEDAVAVPETYFTDLFIRNCCGFTGGDGTYSVLLPDGRTVWIFGDTFLGTVNPDMTREQLSPMFIRNSFVIQDGDSLLTLYQSGPTHEASMVIPPAINGNEVLPESAAWFWPGDGMIEEGKLKVYLSRFTQSKSGMWDFQWHSTWLATFSLPEIKEESVIEIPYGQAKQVHYGHALLEEPDYTYVYGAHEGRPHAARYLAGDVTNPWEFFTGEKWTGDPAQSGPMGDMHASEQFTVLKIQDKYVYITQLDSFSTDICSFVAETPYGPWKDKSLLYSTPIPGEDENLITYNAILHPQFMDDERILLSYNMNSFVLEDHFSNADIYRPRFVWVPLKLIDTGF
ncbi:MAG: DUF5005 domain-containing protein [Bacteroidales bacterium]|nr:DUF5005 domain-containing protein [Bacteroidales bacterium]